MSNSPWKKWIPGVLSKSQIKELIDGGYLCNANGDIDSSSIDLCLSEEGYEMTEGSVKPYGGGYLHKIKTLSNRLSSDSGIFLLKKKKTYLFRLKETLQGLNDVHIFGEATAKSTIGRVDVLARLIVDGMDCYECFNPKGLMNGRKDMFLEITPITFDVKVKEGISLSQLRLFYCKPRIVEMSGTQLYESLLHIEDKANNSLLDGSLSVDLAPIEIGSKKGVAFRAKDDENLEAIELWVRKRLDPKKYWDFIPINDKGRLNIDKNAFYILKSKERISLKSGIAVYCRAIDESIGEMRIHYAGFAHPYFGTDRKDKREGTPLIFEVRGHDVNVSLGNGEKMARLIFYRMSIDAQQKDKEDDAYTNQELKLSNIFKDWE